MTTMNHYLVRAGLRVPDLDASVQHAVEVLGLQVRNRDDVQASLALPGQEPALVLRADASPSFDFMVLHTSEANLTEVEARVDRLGVTRSEPVELDQPGIRIHAPNGIAIEIGVGEAPARNTTPRPGAPVIGSLDHLSFTAKDPAAFLDFFVQVLGFRLSDSVNEDRHWLRCNANHHTVAVFTGDDGLHHYAFETADVGGLAALGDVLAARNQNFIWGPGRHGLGQNIFTYHLDPAGVILEVTSNMLQVDDEEWEVEVWTDGLKSAVMWGPLPPAGFRDHAIPAHHEEKAVQ